MRAEKRQDRAAFHPAPRGELAEQVRGRYRPRRPICAHDLLFGLDKREADIIIPQGQIISTRCRQLFLRLVERFSRNSGIFKSLLKRHVWTICDLLLFLWAYGYYGWDDGWSGTGIKKSEGSLVMLGFMELRGG
jgi:hypothetical protein